MAENISNVEKLSIEIKDDISVTESQNTQSFIKIRVKWLRINRNSYCISKINIIKNSLLKLYSAIYKRVVKKLPNYNRFETLLKEEDN